MADTLASEAFDLAWYPRASDTAAQVARMAARHAAGSDALAQRVRARQDLAARLVVQEANLLKEIGRPAGQADAARTAKLREAEAKTRSELEALDAALERDFPRYGELTSPRPLTLAAAQRLVGPNEALLALLFSGDEGYV